ncbi:uncharacterized protein LOC115476245 [Microcaecilia unicolor]|uniref:Chloride channel CLIC-like protein 1 n=1 Tax=Microcaecilia unicolor TaxID=1415580 RepID=A0A6P7YLW3_9AMPH|nr:uncharacterized protein LOC115476245 [Microcaecilia unicolor]
MCKISNVVARMDSIRTWLLEKIIHLKHTILGTPDPEPVPLYCWSLESPFQTWNIYSKILLAASILLFVAILISLSCRRPVLHSEAKVKRRAAARTPSSPVTVAGLLHAWLQGFVCLLALCMILTVPWEWVRLYQIEVAKKMAVLSEGFAKNCNSENPSFWEMVRICLSWHFAWANDSCEVYYRALMVNPFWEVTPLMAISSAVSRIIVHPLELLSQEMGKSLRNVMKEVPSQWQPFVFILIPLLCFIFPAIIIFKGQCSACATYDKQIITVPLTCTK